MRNSKVKNELWIFWILSLLISYNCQKHPKKKISNNELSAIVQSCPKQVYPASLYYLDGDCSLCLAKAKEFDEKQFSKGAAGLILFKVSNPPIARMYIRDISLHCCVILDSSNLFAKSFIFNNIYKLSENGEILSGSPDK